jgi:hypothetical protein
VINRWGNYMARDVCGSENQRQFTGEIAIHFSGLSNIGKQPVWVFPKLLVCLSCGMTEFVVPENELHRLAEQPGDWLSSRH